MGGREGGRRGCAQMPPISGPNIWFPFSGWHFRCAYPLKILQYTHTHTHTHTQRERMFVSVLHVTADLVIYSNADIIPPYIMYDITSLIINKPQITYVNTV